MEMNELIGYLFGYGMPIVVLLVVLLVMVFAMGAAVSWTRYIVLGYVICVLIIPLSTSFGTLDGGNTNNFWVKGTKSFFFSFLDMMLFGTWILGVLFVSGWLGRKKSDNYNSPMAISYIAFGLLFLGYVVLALFGSAPFILEFGSRGVINVFWQGMLISLLLATVRTERDLKLLTWIILTCLAGQEAWGLFRYLFLGGDPQNYYANFELVGVKMTFWDISDSILACLMIGFVTWKLLVERLSSWEKVGFALLGIMALLTPILTSRRTAQGAMFLAMAVLFFLLPRGRRSPILIVLTLAVPLTIAALVIRSGDRDRTFIEKVTIDVKFDDKSDPRDNRFYELQTAWKTIREEPFFGVGPSGSFKVTSPVGLYYHNGHYDYVHSGFGHVLLKTGFVGLIIFFSIFVTFIFHVKKGWRLILPEHKALAVGAICGFAAEMPSFFFGNPVIEIRSMQVGGILFAIPLICIALGKRKAVNSKDDRFNSSNK